MRIATQYPASILLYTVQPVSHAPSPRPIPSAHRQQQSASVVWVWEQSQLVKGHPWRLEEIIFCVGTKYEGCAVF